MFTVIRVDGFSTKRNWLKPEDVLDGALLNERTAQMVEKCKRSPFSRKSAEVILDDIMDNMSIGFLCTVMVKKLIILTGSSPTW